ncbi:MAG: S46 family peptidase, partial [Gemmatimonadetes bacterium]|nr:S46 family peptidase [Gemmatimonadota bacterium]
MPALRVLSRSATTAALFLLLGCASRGGSPEGAPAPAAAAPANAMSPLEPPPGALRTADRVQLTGLELGTMWTFENPPLEYWKTRYGFEPTAEWLEHVRLASVRYGEICSASFVSPNGLVMTNHHCARDCVEAVSTDTRDYVIEGFYAATRNDELLCPDLFLDQLVSIEDVTERVQAAAPAGAAERAIAEAQEAEQQEIVQECEAASGLQCQVVSLFHGGQYRLYRYQRYAPVKLVFAPELQAGFFGGDPDNFTYPRYDLDVAFVRAYQSDGKAPLGTPQYFRWDADGAAEEELVFITGNPGGTSRQATVAQLMYERSYRHRFIVRLRQEQRDFLRGVAARGPEAERQVRDQLFNIENSLKAYTGQLAGLNDTLLLGRKLRWEREFRQKVEAYAKLRESYGDIWDRIARIQAEKLTV